MWILWYMNSILKLLMQCVCAVKLRAGDGFVDAEDAVTQGSERPRMSVESLCSSGSFSRLCLLGPVLLPGLVSSPDHTPVPVHLPQGLDQHQAGGPW